MKRALIITYYWPPAGGPGVQRWLKFVKYFREFGVEPIVYAPENPNYPLIDENFSSEIPSDIKILKKPIKEPYRFAKLFSKKKTKQISSGIISKKEISVLEKLMLYIRGNFFIPDARVGWVKPSVKFLSEYISENPVDVVITTGPPHSLHLIGMQLHKELDVKWMADFRDPWTTIHYHSSLRLSKSSKRKHKALEASVLKSADIITVTSPTTKKEFGMITEKPIEVITNGYDITEKIDFEIDSVFSISHIGSLLSERNPEILWKVLAEICKENALFKNDLQLKFAGAVSDEVKQSLENFQLLENCKFLGYVSHSEALRLQHTSQVLILVEINRAETRAIIPGKLFEYLAAKRPIIALGPKESDIEGIIAETNSGKFFSYWDNDELKDALLQLYKDFKSGDLMVSSEGIEKYSRRELTKQMASLVLN
ncbi:MULTISPECIES: glycosyltransferase family 4 protein [Aequorivita]|uniref:Glycosyltransferase family 4 protein n=1 Tax=Aequorivita iocasae TaxID=2803865 RepID=A0ABX7DQF4_9FLAO|nr:MULTISPECIES: glycosyltransferase family 4 protein [Aequorivita]QQX76350.1 glycosyltransferase family 4 protein [Aequorivita iocasae]UCA55815.1 glycosyltransferase family 4 protein [Aequorivita sp. F7]